MNYQRTSCCGRSRCSLRQSCFRRSCYARASQHSQNGTRRRLRSTDSLRRTPCSLRLDSQRLSPRSLPIVPSSCARWVADPTETPQNQFAQLRAQPKAHRASPERSSLSSSDHRLDDLHHSLPRDLNFHRTMSAGSNRNFRLSFCRQDSAARWVGDWNRSRRSRRFGYNPRLGPSASNPPNSHCSSPHSNRAMRSSPSYRDSESSHNHRARRPNSRMRCRCYSIHFVASRHTLRRFRHRPSDRSRRRFHSRRSRTHRSRIQTG